MTDMKPAGRHSLGSTIRAYREQAGLSQRQLAAMAELHHSLLARIESGEVEKPGAELLQRLSDTLEIDAQELLGFIGVRPTLPEPHTYFRKEFGVSDKEAREIVRHINERYGKQPKNEPNKGGES
jgi:transcriptional regulator with XRE-family HTH domain